MISFRIPCASIKPAEVPIATACRWPSPQSADSSAKQLLLLSTRGTACKGGGALQPAAPSDIFRPVSAGKSPARRCRYRLHIATRIGLSSSLLAHHPPSSPVGQLNDPNTQSLGLGTALGQDSLLRFALGCHLQILVLGLAWGLSQGFQVFRLTLSKRTCLLRLTVPIRWIRSPGRLLAHDSSLLFIRSPARNTRDTGGIPSLLCMSGATNERLPCSHSPTGPPEEPIYLIVYATPCQGYTQGAQPLRSPSGFPQSQRRSC